MAKLTTTDLANLNNPSTAVSTINSNMQAIRVAMEKTLSRDGTSPNSMDADFDMDSHRILNLPEAVADTEPVRKAELDELVADIAAGTAIAQATLDGLVSDAQAAATAAAASAASLVGQIGVTIQGYNATLQGLNSKSTTGTGNIVLATSPTITTPTITSPTMTTPTLGVATATSLNKVTITAPATASTFTLADGKTLTVSNTLTLAGTDGTTMTFPDTTGTVATLNKAQTFSAAQTMGSTLNVTGTTTLGTVSATTYQLSGSALLDTDTTLAANSDSKVSTQKATKTYVDNAVAGGTPMTAAAVASTANLTLSGEQTIDGVLTSTSRILVKNQTTATENGVYTTAAGAWTRTTDADDADEFALKTIFVSGGSTQAGTTWKNTNAAITIGVTNVTFVQTGSSTSYSAGTGLSLGGTVFSLNAAASNLTNGTTGSGSVVLATTPTFVTSAVFPGTAIWNSTGIGVGTTSPSKKVHVTGTSNEEGIRVENTGAGGLTWDILATRNASSLGGNKLVFYDASNSLGRMFITSTGTVGVGNPATFTPDSSYHVDVDGILNADTLKSGTLTNKPHWHTSLNVMDYSADPTGTSATFHTVLQNAWAAALALGSGEILIPAGVYKFGGTAVLTGDTPLPAGIRIRGAGDGMTRFVHNSTTGNFIRFGDTAGSQMHNVILEDLTFDGSNGNTATVTAGCAIEVRNAHSFKFRNLDFYKVWQAFLLGDDDPGVFYTEIINCAGHAGGTGQRNWIDLGDGGLINIHGNRRWEGGSTGAYFIAHSDSDNNWDGLDVSGGWWEEWARIVSVDGTADGFANLRWTNTYMDRTTSALFYCDAGTTNHKWLVANNTMQVDGNRAFFFQSTNNPRYMDIMIQNNQISFSDSNAIRINQGSVEAEGIVITGNNFCSCGTDQVPLIYFNAKSGIVANNFARHAPGNADPNPYTYGIQWVGASTGERSSSGNLWADAASGNETGTA